jgi:hypothetical protein
VLHTIVEGEPGIFPDPVARVMRRIGGWFGHRRSSTPTADTPPPPPHPTTDPDDRVDGPGNDPGADGHSGDSR